MSSQSDNPRRRTPRTKSQAEPASLGIKQINAAPLLERAKPGINPDDRLTLAKVIGNLAVMISAVLPSFISWGTTAGLIFGGCCSNVGRI